MWPDPGEKLNCIKISTVNILYSDLFRIQGEGYVIKYQSDRSLEPLVNVCFTQQGKDTQNIH